MGRRLLALFLALALFGLAKKPWETRLALEQREAGYRPVTLDVSLREQLGQSAFLATLSGFRSLVAAYFWIEAHTAWEQTDWGRMNFLLNLVVTLQPRAQTYWEMAGWHMAWNASVAARNDPNIEREALRIRAEREYFDLGESYFARGIQNLPDNWELHARYALFLVDKLGEHCRAAELYERAGEMPNHLPYVRRMAAYQLAACPGQEKAALEKLRSLYLEGPQNHLPTLLRILWELENNFEVPQEQRLLSQPPPDF